MHYLRMDRPTEAQVNAMRVDRAFAVERRTRHPHRRIIQSMIALETAFNMYQDIYDSSMPLMVPYLPDMQDVPDFLVSLRDLMKTPRPVHAEGTAREMYPVSQWDLTAQKYRGLSRRIAEAKAAAIRHILDTTPQKDEESDAA